MSGYFFRFKDASNNTAQAYEDSLHEQISLLKMEIYYLETVIQEALKEGPGDQRCSGGRPHSQRDADAGRA